MTMKLTGKKTTVIMAVVLTALMTAGCASPGDGSNGGTTANDVDYELVNDDMMDEGMKDKIQQIKDKKGYGIIKEDDCFYYIYIGMGEKSTGGYDVEIISVKAVDGKIKIFVEEIEPEKDEVVIQVITYPFEVLRIEKEQSRDIVVVNESDEEYDAICDLK
jgi:hypothetical protein